VSEPVLVVRAIVGPHLAAAFLGARLT